MTDVLVRTLRHLGGYKFYVEFSDGMAGEWDYSRVLQRPGPMAAPLHDATYLARAFLVNGAPTWPNGWDVSPDALYKDLSLAGALKATHVAAE
ncbi:MAG: DUF2442 domain-containing protein [Phycisphaerales bacterium]|nr:DUF2442 domain-containing protein [Hyphomonadaceae bacterium]